MRGVLPLSSGERTMARREGMGESNPPWRLWRAQKQKDLYRQFSDLSLRHGTMLLGLDRVLRA